MPVLNLSFWNTPKLHRLDCFEVEAAMLFPSDVAIRRHYMLNEAIKWFESEEDVDTKTLLRDEILVPTNDHEALHRLLNHQSATKRLGSKIAKAYDLGCIAGQIAAILWLSVSDSAIEIDDRIRALIIGPATLGAKRPKHSTNEAFDKLGVYAKSPKVADAMIEGRIRTSKPNIRKAKRAIVRTYKRQRLTRNRDYVDKAWQSHKPVAHLWARLVLASSEQILVENNPKTTFNFFLRPHVPEFIVLAEEILQFLRERKNTIKDPWLAPVYVKLPPREELTRDTLPLSPDLSEALRRYKADSYRR
jgi:hypothetical protein